MPDRSRPRFRPFRLAVMACFLACLLAVLSGCGTRQFVPAGRPSRELAPAVATRVVNTIKKQIGARYRYGGSTPRGFDCSGLIWWGFRQHGIAVPRVAADQAVAGRGVSVSAARPGDILVFRTSAGLHTGLYAGKNLFIHAPSSGKRVREESLRNTYWRPRLTAVRRMYG